MLESPAQNERGADESRRRPGVRLLDEVAEMELAIPAEERKRARDTVLAPLHMQEVGPLTGVAIGGASHPFGLLMIGGIVFARTSMRDRPATEILTAGDVFDPWTEDEPSFMPTRTEYEVYRAVRLAVLDDRFRLAARRWPGLHDVVRAQMAHQARRASRSLAILQLPRVEDRILAFFLDLAERMGRVTSAGIAIDLPLTHALVGEAVGSRRPTVSLALTELAADGLITREAGGIWMLAPGRFAAA
jgi:hypothetical protein